MQYYLHGVLCIKVFLATQISYMLCCKVVSCAVTLTIILVLKDYHAAPAVCVASNYPFGMTVKAFCLTPSCTLS